MGLGLDNTILTNVVKDIDREGKDGKETVGHINEVNIKQKKKSRDLLKEATSLHIKKKDALGINLTISTYLHRFQTFC